MDGDRSDGLLGRWTVFEVTSGGLELQGEMFTAVSPRDAFVFLVFFHSDVVQIEVPV